MKLKVEKSIASFEITITSEQFEEGIKKSYAKNGKKFSVPGFRKGKATRGMIEKNYGEDVFYDDAIELSFSEPYEAAIKELDLKVVGTPSVDIVSLDKKEGVVLSVEVPVMPEVTLGKYTDLGIEKVEYKAGIKEVRAELDKMVKENARQLDVSDRPVKNEDITVIDFEGSIDGVLFEGGTATDFTLEIGSGAFIPGFEDQLIGAEIGKEVNVNVTFPKEYKVEELAGKPALFKVTVKEISEKEYPEQDDEFAKDVSEFDTLEELKADIKKKLKAEATKKTENEYENAIVDAVVANATLEIPQIMIDQEIGGMLRDFDYQLRTQGLDLDTYMKYMNMNIETMKEQYKEMATKRVKSQLVLEKIAEVEKIEATEKDIKEEIKKYAEQANKTIEEIEKTLTDNNMQGIKEGVVLRKTITFLAK